MKPRTKTALGIDIGSRRISAALVERTPRGIRIIAAANGDLPVEDPQKSGVRAKAMSRVLRQLGRRAGTRGVGIAVAVSVHSTIMRLLDLPRQMPTNISEFVDAELSQYVSLSGRRKQTDFCGIETGSASQKRLLAVGADAEETGKILQTCGAAGITVDSVEPAALAYARAFLAGERGMAHNGSTLIGVLSVCNLVVCLFCKGTLDFVRVRDLPADVDTPGRLSAWLTEELSQVLRYHRTAASSGSSEVQTRLVIHDAAYDKNEIAPPFSPNMGSSVVMDSCEPGACPFGEASPMPSAMAVGAALKLLGLDGDELRIDLTPHDVILARSSSKRLLIAANAAAIVFFAVFLIVQFLTHTTAAMNRRIGRTRLDGQLYTMPAAVARDRYLDEEILWIQRQLAGMDVVRAKHEVDWPVILNAIGRSAPPGVYVTHLACDDSRVISLKGLAVSYEEAKMLVQNLDGRGLFESVHLARMEQRQADANAVEYEIECTLKTVKQESSRDDKP